MKGCCSSAPLLAAHAREHGPVAGRACLAELAPSTVHVCGPDATLSFHTACSHSGRSTPTVARPELAGSGMAALADENPETDLQDCSDNRAKGYCVHIQNVHPARSMEAEFDIRQWVGR
jgi:hypothetical protein